MNADLSWSEIRWREHRSSPYLHDSTATASALAQDRVWNERSPAEQHLRHMESSDQPDHGVITPMARSPAKSLQETGSSTSSAPRNYESHDMTQATFNGRIPQSLEIPMLPSFASLQKTSLGDHGPNATSATMDTYSKPSCRGCNDRTSLLEDIADAVAGLDEAWQLRPSNSPARNRERFQTDVFQTAQWIITRLHDAKSYMQKPALPFSSGYRSHQPPEDLTSGYSNALTPPGLIKRSPESQLFGYPEPNKRKRTSSYTDSYVNQRSNSRHLEDQRRASDSVQRSEPYRTHSPFQLEYVTSHAHTQAQSPGQQARSIRPLPSPASLANTSHKSPWAAPTVPPGSSPTISQRTSSIHTASISSAASQHVADLQHQITLKSLALQTLQSEYTSLLQKFQRDRMRSQTFEKKTVAAEQEVNELTNKNEELNEQVRTLEGQVQAAEKNHENERMNSVREKDQWGKMLEMSGRLQAKNAEERQSLMREKQALQHQLQALENRVAHGASKSAHSPYGISAQDDEDPGIHKASGNLSVDYQGKLAASQHDNAALQSRLTILRTALERIERQTTSMIEKRRELLEQEEQLPGDIASFLKATSTLPTSKSRGSGSVPQETHELPEGSNRGQSVGLSSPWRPSSTSGPSTFSPNDKAPAQTRSPPEIHAGHAKSSTTISPTDKQTSRLTSVPLPQRQPPNTSTIQTEPLANNQRRPSGPATPYPGSEPKQWEFPQRNTSSPPTTEARGMNQIPHYPLPAFGVDKTPTPNYTPHHVPVSDATTMTPLRSDDCSSMPPPPRPAVGPAPSTSAVPTPWRSS